MSCTGCRVSVLLNSSDLAWQHSQLSAGSHCGGGKAFRRVPGCRNSAVQRLPANRGAGDRRSGFGLYAFGVYRPLQAFGFVGFRDLGPAFAARIREAFSHVQPEVHDRPLHTRNSSADKAASPKVPNHQPLGSGCSHGVEESVVRLCIVCQHRGHYGPKHLQQ